MMKLKEQTSGWPPLIEGNGAAVDLNDTVLRVFRKEGDKHGLALRLQSAEGLQYEVSLPLPEKIRYTVAVAIVLMQGHTLGDIGELEIAEAFR